MPVVHKNLARLRFAEEADLQAAMADAAFRLLVLRVLGRDVYLRPDDLDAALSILARLDLWYHREEEA